MFTFKRVAIVWVIFSIAIWATFIVYKAPCLSSGPRCDRYLHEYGAAQDRDNPYIKQLKTSWLKKSGEVLYPWEARNKGVEGAAVVRMLINKDGKIIRRGLNRSSGSPILDAAALDALWTFEVDPAGFGEGVKFPYEKLLSVKFKLSDG